MRDAVLLTGAAGFIGAHLARELIARDFDVVGLDDLSGGYRDNVPDEAEFIEGSILDVELLRSLFDAQHFRYVYHLAAYAAEGLSHFIRRFNYTNNLVGSVNLLNEAVRAGTDCFVFTSSIAVYGSGQVPMRESMVPQPEDPYGIAKYAVEMDLAAAHEMFGLDYVIFRPHNVYGEYQNIGDRYRNVVGIFMNQILRGEPLTIFGDGAQQRAFSYVGDITGPIAAAPWTPAARNQVFNVGAETPYTVNALAAAVMEAMGVRDHPVVHLDPRNEVRLAYSSHERLHEVFGVGQQTSLEQGLQRMTSWVRKVGARHSRDFSAIEVSQNMPPSWASTGAKPAVGN